MVIRCPVIPPNAGRVREKPCFNFDWFKGEPIIRIRIRTAIIRIRTTDTRILRIIRIRTGEELMGVPRDTVLPYFFFACCNHLDFGLVASCLPKACASEGVLFRIGASPTMQLVWFFSHGHTSYSISSTKGNP